MPITFRCQCGRMFRTADENAGRNATCPDCRAQFVVPATAAAPAVVLPPPIPDEPPIAQAAESEEVVPVPPRSGPSSPYGWDRRYDPGDADDRPRGRADYRRDDIRDRIRRRPTPAPNMWTDGGVLKGLGLMVLGVVITVGGLAVGWILFPGPIFFILGIVCLIKGIASGKM